MLNNDDVMTLMRKHYPDITEENATYLAQRTLSWVTLLGNTTLKRVEEANAAGRRDWEIRAIILATSVISRMFTGFTQVQSEIDSLNALIDLLLTLNNETVNTL